MCDDSHFYGIVFDVDARLEGNFSASPGATRLASSVAPRSLIVGTTDLATT